MYLDNDPVELFRGWYEEARQAVQRIDVLALATATTEGIPSVRMVSFKGLHDGDFTFCTDARSRKGRELIANPRAAIAFYWPELRRQIRVEGRCTKLPEAESKRMFDLRERESQFTAVASIQSEKMSDPAALDRRLEQVRTQVGDEDLPRPPHWSGFMLEPQSIEFWMGKEHRRHRRLLYEFRENGWTRSELFP